jgi:branched-chain amino acid transport system permease protein
MTRSPLLRHLLLGLGGAAVLYVATTLLSTYNDFQVGEVALYAVALAGLSLLVGNSGQISLGHGALMAVGGYTIALLQVHTHVALSLELLASVVAATALGVLVGIPATRVQGPYLAGLTLILALALPLLADRYTSIFGGDQGLTTLPPTAPGSIDPERWLAWIEAIAAIVILVLLANLRSSRFGRAFRAVRDDEVAAALAGIHVARVKVLAFAVSAACAGLAGALLGLSSGVVNTGEFPLSLSIDLLAAVVLGGVGTLAGVWWGAVLLVYLPQWSTSVSRDLGLGAGVAAYLATIIFGLVLIVVMMVAPNGIQGGLAALWRGVSPQMVKLTPPAVRHAVEPWLADSRPAVGSTRPSADGQQHSTSTLSLSGEPCGPPSGGDVPATRPEPSAEGHPSTFEEGQRSTRSP